MAEVQTSNRESYCSACALISRAWKTKFHLDEHTNTSTINSLQDNEKLFIIFQWRKMLRKQRSESDHKQICRANNSVNKNTRMSLEPTDYLKIEKENIIASKSYKCFDCTGHRIEWRKHTWLNVCIVHSSNFHYLITFKMSKDTYGWW